jgi:hypothetical protein
MIPTGRAGGVREGSEENRPIPSPKRSRIGTCFNEEDAMKIVRRAIPVALTVLIATTPVAADLMIYPKKKQSAEQQSKDKYQCHEWAVQQTGFDPMSSSSQPVAAAPPTGRQPNAVRGAARGAAVGAVGGAIAGDAGKGAAAGAAGGAMIGAVRRRDQRINAEAEAAQQNAGLQGQRANYDRAVKTCLEARDYSVN